MRTKRSTSIMADEVFRFSDLALEIQLLIFEQFDRPTLHCAVQVNKRWHDMSASLLWRGPSIRRLRTFTHLQCLQRRQYYASKIQTLESRTLGLTFFLDNDTFSSLKVLRLLVHPRVPQTMVNLDPYLQTRLTALSLRGCELRQHSLDLISSRCPALTKLELCGPLVDVEDSEFANFIRSLSCLRQIFLAYMFDVSAATLMFNINTEVLAPKIERLGLYGLTDFPNPEPFRKFMMNCRSLQRLTIQSRTGRRPLRLMTSSVLAHVMNANPLHHIWGDWLNPGLLEQVPVSSTSLQSFGKLRSLTKWGCSSSALSILLQSSDRLERLELCLYDVTTQLFSSIGDQKQLKYLTIASATNDLMFSIAHLLALSSLTSLEYLNIASRGRRVGLSTVQGLSDSTFSQLISGFSRLTTLVLDLELPVLGSASIRSLSQACPLLERCALIYRHDLSTWASTQTTPSPSFPNLISLYLGSVTDHDWEETFLLGFALHNLASSANRPLSITDRARSFAEMLLGCAPRLERFGIETNTIFGTALQRALSQMKPRKSLRPGDVAEVFIVTVEGRFDHTDFDRYP